MASLAAENQGDGGFGSSARQTALAAAPAQRALAAITPSRAALAGWGALAAAAGNTQSALSTLSAQATVTEARMGKLSSGMQSLARSYGIGNSGARELYTTLGRLGTIAQGTENGVARLAVTFTKLSGAVGEGSSGLASGFVQLNRAMSTGLDAGRMGRLADSLTTVADKSGASATGILQFAKVIAPMAQATGIGETKVLGISAAFSKMGDDGVGAATAVNKMLGDLNRSIRDGSPMINTYAQIVGKTTDQFTALMKANPAEAITQVTEALGKSGGNAPRQLEMLGLDGVRTQRYLQELAQSGGLRSAINTSVGAYGSGSTQKAAAAAFDTWANATQKASANAQQLGEALGAPLLGPLTKFTDAMGAAITPFRALAQTGVAQKLLEFSGGLLVASKVLRMMGTGLMVGGAATSGPVRSLFAGLANARGAGEGSLLYRLGGGVSPLVASGEPIGRGAMVPVNAAFSKIGSGLGTAFTAVNPGEGPGMVAQMRGLGFGGYTAWTRGSAEMFRNARLPAEERSLRLTPRAGRFSGGVEAGRVFDAAHANMVANEAALRGGLITPGEHLRMNMAEFGRIRTALAGQTGLQGAAMAARGLGATVGQTALSGAALAGRGVLSALGGPVGIGLTAGTIGYASYQGQVARQRQFEDDARTASGGLDELRVAMGKATEAVSTFAGKTAQSAEQLISGVSTMSQALTVDSNAQQIANRQTGQKETFSGSEASIRATIRQRIQAGATPDEVAQMRTDLMKQYDAKTAGRILSGLPQSADLNASSVNDIRAQVRGSAGYYEGGLGGGLRGAYNIAQNVVVGGVRRVLDPVQGVKDVVGAVLHPGRAISNFFSGDQGTSGGFDRITGGQKKVINDIVGSIDARRSQRADASGDAFANSRARTEIDAAVDEAIKSGNASYLYETEKAFQSKYGMKKRNISAADIEKAGGFANYSARHGGGSFADTFGTTSTQAQVQAQQNLMFTTLSGNALQAAFSGQGTSSAQKAVQALIGPTGSPESPQAQTAALQAVMGTAGPGSDGLQKLAEAALDAANKLGDVSDAGKLAQAAFAQVAQQISANAAFQTSGGAAMSQASLYATQARITPNDQTTAAEQKQGVQGLQQIRAEAVQAAQQRLTQIREYQVSMSRAAVDYQRQVEYSAADFHRGQLRAEEDYGKAVYRTQRNYQVQMADAQDDYQRQRSIAFRDFNKQQAREAEDAAKTMYDPYQRIQAKGVWDPVNLAQNEREQNTAMRNQLANLKAVRRAGLSNPTITLLGLNDPNNAQQLASMVGSLVNDPKLVASLNAQTTQRKSLAGALLGDPSDTAFQRQKADFATSMSDAAKAYSISVQRAARNLHTQLGDMASDQSQALARSRQDYGINLQRMMQANAVMILRAGQDLERSQQQIVGNLDQLTDALAQGTQVKIDTWKGIVQNGMADWTKVLKAFSSGDWAALTASLSAPAAVMAVSPQTAAAHHDPDYRKHASGAIFNRPVFSGRDEAGEAEPELVLPLDSRGARFLSDTMARMGSPLASRMAAGSVGQVVINHNDTYHYDSSVRPEHVEVTAGNANELGEELRRKAAFERGKRPAVLR